MAVERNIVARELGHSIGQYLECVNLYGFRELVGTESSAALERIQRIINNQALNDTHCLKLIATVLDAFELHTWRHRFD